MKSKELQQLSTIVHTLAKQKARRQVKALIKHEGYKVHDYSAKEITELANRLLWEEYPALIAQAYYEY